MLIALVFVGLRVRKYLQAKERRRQADQFAKRVKLEKEKPIRDWLAQIKIAGYDNEMLVAVGNPPAGWEDFENVTEMIQRQQRSKSYLAEFAALTKDADVHMIKIRQTTDPVRQYELLFEVSSHYVSSTEDKHWIEVQRCEKTPLYADLLLQLARGGDSASFIKLNKLTQLSEYDYSDYRTRTNSHYTHPTDWNDLTARFYENPSLADFRILNCDPTEGSVRLMAAEALANRSLRDAKIVLAHCATENFIGSYRNEQIIWPWRSEIGDVLMAELAKMVVAIHAEKMMFVR